MICAIHPTHATPCPRAEPCCAANRRLAPSRSRACNPMTQLCSCVPRQDFPCPSHTHLTLPTPLCVYYSGARVHAGGFPSRLWHPAQHRARQQRHGHRPREPSVSGFRHAPRDKRSPVFKSLLPCFCRGLAGPCSLWAWGFYSKIGKRGRAEVHFCTSRRRSAVRMPGRLGSPPLRRRDGRGMGGSLELRSVSTGRICTMLLTPGAKTVLKL
jgi:hypothetical protein